MTARGRRHALDRAAKDADAIGKIGLLRAASGQRNSFIEAEERPAARELLGCGLVLYDDLEVSDPLTKFCGQLLEGVTHEASEASAA